MKMGKYRCVDLQAVGSLNLESKDENCSNNQDQKKQSSLPSISSFQTSYLSFDSFKAATSAF